MFTNPFALMGAMLTLKRLKDNNVTGSERNKAFLFPLLVKDPAGAMITSDLAATKAIETKKLKQAEASSTSLQETTKAALVIADEAVGALKTLKGNLDAAVINAMNAAEVKKHIADVVLPALEIKPSQEIQNTIIKNRPEFSDTVKQPTLKFDNLKDIFNKP